MKQNAVQDYSKQLSELKKQLEITEKKLDFVTDARLNAALCYEVLSIRARMGYIIESAKISV